MIKSFGGGATLSMARDSSEMLSNRFFGFMLVVALLLHLAALGVWSLMPSPQIIDIPVRALSIKLGEGEPVPEEKPAASQANNDGVENTLSRMAHEQAAANEAREKSVVKSMEKAIAPTVPATTNKKNAKAAARATAPSKPIRGKEKKFDLRAEPNSVAAPVMEVTARQFVRDTNPVVKVGGSIPGEGNASNTQMLSRYEQLVSLWIQKFKLYPEAARADFLRGEALVRIRIDRRGNIRDYVLERSTGHEILDRAAVDMIRRANPVPAVPNDYPAGETFEFLIPVNFQLQ